MAIKIKLDFPSGISIASAYVKVSEVIVSGVASKYQDPPTLSGMARWDVYADEESRKANKQAVMSGQSMFTLTSESTVLPQAYENLKTLPQFAGAVDC
jgi:hypothetical protein